MPSGSCAALTPCTIGPKDYLQEGAPTKKNWGGLVVLQNLRALGNAPQFWGGGVGDVPEGFLVFKHSPITCFHEATPEMVNHTVAAKTLTNLALLRFFLAYTARAMRDEQKTLQALAGRESQTGNNTIFWVCVIRAANNTNFWGGNLWE